MLMSLHGRDLWRKISFFWIGFVLLNKANLEGRRTQIAVSGVPEMGWLERACLSPVGSPIFLRLFSIPHHRRALPRAGEKSL